MSFTQMYEIEVGEKKVRLEYKDLVGSVLFEFCFRVNGEDTRVIYITVYRPLTINFNNTIQRELNKALLKYNLEKLEQYKIHYLTL